MPGIYGQYNPGCAADASADEQRAEYEKRWAEGGLTFMGSFSDLMLNQASNDSVANFVRDKIREIVDDRQVADLLCPKNIIGGKRLCVDSNYFAHLQS